MKPVEATWVRAIKFWWSLFRRSTLMAILLGSAAGLIFGALGSAPYVPLAGALPGCVVYAAVRRSFIGKQISDFREIFVETMADGRTG